LRNHVMDGVYVTSVRIMTSEDLMECCEIRTTALPSISIEVRLPLWSMERQILPGCLRWFLRRPGRVDKRYALLERGYAAATSDSGYHGLDIADAT